MCKRNGVDKVIMKTYKDSLNYPVVCKYCGKELDKDSTTVDHLIPLTRGGKSVYSNFGPACKSCNDEKSCLTDGEYLDILKNSKNESEKKARIKEIENKVLNSTLNKISDGKNTLVYRGYADYLVNINELTLNYRTSKILADVDKADVLEKLYNMYIETGVFEGVIHISRKGVVVKGFTLYEMAKKYGIEHVPVKEEKGGAFLVKYMNRKPCRIPLQADNMMALGKLNKMNKPVIKSELEYYLSNLNFFLEFGFFQEPVYVFGNSIIGNTAIVDIAKSFGVPFVPVKYVAQTEEYLYKY